MDILVSRTLYMSCQAGPGIEPGPSALKSSALPIELTWQTVFKHVAPNGHLIPTVYLFMADIANSVKFLCDGRTWICLDITRFYEEQR